MNGSTPLLAVLLTMDWAAALTIILGLPVVALVAVPMFMVWSHHRRKMEELRLKEHRLIADDIHAEFKAIRKEIQELRDTTMQYDLSFDTALHQVEHRLKHLEKAQHHLQHAQHTAETPTQNITLGGRG